MVIFVQFCHWKWHRCHCSEEVNPILWRHSMQPRLVTGRYAQHISKFLRNSLRKFTAAMLTSIRPKRFLNTLLWRFRFYLRQQIVLILLYSYTDMDWQFMEFTHYFTSSQRPNFRTYPNLRRYPITTIYLNNPTKIVSIFCTQSHWHDIVVDRRLFQFDFYF